jgi:pimeloyl-ACP methyl ester carboxylesterase
LERIKQERQLPPMSGKAVIVLHGLVRSRESMRSLGAYLREKGGYHVFAFGYPSTRADVAEHARSLRHVIEHLDGIEEINFVGHSLGNIVVRRYLGDLNRLEAEKSVEIKAAVRRDRAKFHRFVMLGPPNQGAQLADVFAENLVFKEVFGDSGQQLGRDWAALEKRLATPSFDFGIIAGGKGTPKGYNPILVGDNDGAVSVETTKLVGARDFLVTPVLHSFLMGNERVQECVLRFLKKGYFVSDEERHPLGAVE